MSDKHIIKILERMKLELKKEISKTDSEINYRPTSELLDVHQEFGELLAKYKGKDRLKDAFIKKVNELSDRENKAKRRMKHYDPAEYGDLITKKVELESELSEVMRMLYYLQR